MIKLIVVVFEDVLVEEKDFDFTNDKLAIYNLFKKYKLDETFLKEARKIFEKDSVINKYLEKLPSEMYSSKKFELLKELKEKYNKAKIIIYSKSISFMRDFIGENIDLNYVDDIIISSEIHYQKGDKTDLEYILDKYDVNKDEFIIFGGIGDNNLFNET